MDRFYLFLIFFDCMFGHCNQSRFNNMSVVIGSYVAGGYNTIASGGYNMAIGSNVAIGYTAIASGTNNIFIGGYYNLHKNNFTALLASDEFKVAILVRMKKMYTRSVDTLGCKCDLVNQKLKEYLFMECPYIMINIINIVKD